MHKKQANKLKAWRGGQRGAVVRGTGSARLTGGSGIPDMPGMPKQRLYRLWCGRKRHSPWLADECEVLRRAIRLGLAYETNGSTGLGPMTWIEIGERARSKARTIPIGRRGA